jgi:hypothetical protein
MSTILAEESHAQGPRASRHRKWRKPRRCLWRQIPGALAIRSLHGVCQRHFGHRQKSIAKADGSSRQRAHLRLPARLAASVIEGVAAPAQCEFRVRARHGRTRCSDGEDGRNQQHRERWDVAGIDAVRMGKREQYLALGEGFHDHKPDRDDGQNERQEPAPAAGRPRSRHSVDCSGSGTKVGDSREPLAGCARRPPAAQRRASGSRREPRLCRR